MALIMRGMAGAFPIAPQAPTQPPAYEPPASWQSTEIDPAPKPRVLDFSDTSKSYADKPVIIGQRPWYANWIYWAAALAGFGALYWGGAFKFLGGRGKRRPFGGRRVAAR